MKTKKYLKLIILGIYAFYVAGLSFSCSGISQTHPIGHNISFASEGKFDSDSILKSKSNLTGNNKDEVKDITTRMESEKSIEIEKRKVLAENYYQAGLKLYQELRFNEAIDILTKALELNPSHEKAGVLLEEARLAQYQFIYIRMVATG